MKNKKFDKISDNDLQNVTGGVRPGYVPISNCGRVTNEELCNQMEGCSWMGIGKGYACQEFG